MFDFFVLVYDGFFFVVVVLVFVVLIGVLVLFWCDGEIFCDGVVYCIFVGFIYYFCVYFDFWEDWFW